MSDKDDDKKPDLKVVPITYNPSSKEGEEDFNYNDELMAVYIKSRFLLNFIEDEVYKVEALDSLKRAFLFAFDPMQEADKEIDDSFEEEEYE